MAWVGSPAQSQIFKIVVPLKIGFLVAVIAWVNFSDISLEITMEVVIEVMKDYMHGMVCPDWWK